MPSLLENLIDLKPDPLLLDVNFDGYKLSLDSFPIVDSPLPSPARVLSTTNWQFGLEHTTIFSETNSLYFDAHSSTALVKRFYVILDDLRLVSLTFLMNEKRFLKPENVCVLTLPSDFAQREDRYPATLSFPDESFAILANGAGLLSIFDTGNRAEQRPWKECMNLKPLLHADDSGAFTILESRRVSESVVDVLLRSVMPSEGPAGREMFWNKLFWLSFTSENRQWRVGRAREVTCEGHLEMATLDYDGAGVIVASTGEARYSGDSEKAVGRRSVDDAHMEGDEGDREEESMEDEKKACYAWTQDDEFVTAVFTFGETVAKKDVTLSTSSSSVHFSLRDAVLLGGRLGGLIDPSSSTYTIDCNKLELSLCKSGPGSWTELVVGDTRGAYEADKAGLLAASSLLEHCLSENVAGGEPNRNFNTEQLEDCDVGSEKVCKLRWLSGEDHNVKHESDITGHSVLFSASLGSEPRSLCLRMDVDGILWTFDRNDRKPAIHRATFNALGYVQASKTQRKFVTCCADCSYAAIVEAKRHAFIYWQAVALGTDLRNRRSGRRVGDLAKQHLISLSKKQGGEFFDSETVSEDIVGVYADNCALFVLTTRDIFAILLKNPNETV